MGGRKRDSCCEWSAPINSYRYLLKRGGGNCLKVPTMFYDAYDDPLCQTVLLKNSIPRSVMLVGQTSLEIVLHNLKIGLSIVLPGGCPGLIDILPYKTKSAHTDYRVPDFL